MFLVNACSLVRERWRQLIGAPAPRPDAAVVELARLLDAAAVRYHDDAQQHIRWLEQRNAEVTQQLVDALHGGSHGPRVPHETPTRTVDIVTMDPAIIKAIQQKAGVRYERTDLGRTLLFFATTALQSGTSTEEIIKQIERGEESWS